MELIDRLSMIDLINFVHREIASFYLRKAPMAGIPPYNRDEKFVGDLACRHPFGQQDHYLLLAGSQGVIAVRGHETLIPSR